MKKQIISINGSEIVDMTAEEITEHETKVANETARKEAEQQAETQKKADALAGNNKLLELGLTQAQVTAMTGYTPPTEV